MHSDPMATAPSSRTLIQVDELIRDMGELVSLPEVYLRLSEALEDPNTTNEDIAQLLEQDPSLAIRVLKIANSPLYGLARQVEEIRQAVSVLGIRQITEVVLATSASKVIAGIPNVVYDMDDFWRHSILCGTTAQELAKACRCRRPEFAFVGGLLHDIGQLIFFNRYPGQSRVVFQLSLDRHQPMEIFQAEQKVFGFDHALLGGRLLGAWNLPPRLRECVEFHHQPDSTRDFVKEVSIVYIANTLTRMCETEQSTQEIVERIDAKYWEISGLSPVGVEAIVTSADEKVGEIKRTLVS